MKTSHRGLSCDVCRLQLDPEGVPAISPGLRREAGRYPGKTDPKIVPNPEGVALRIQKNEAFTLIELLVVIAILMILAALVDWGPVGKDKKRAIRVQCINNLKQTGLAFRLWEGDAEKYPMFLSQTNGGTMEFTTGPNAFRHFQVMSNELSTPRTLLCPADNGDRFLATNFVNFNNSNISFFVGIVPNEINPMMILAGDHNITNGISIQNGLLDLTTNTPAGWTAEMHNKVGNVALADGSVQQLTLSGLQNTVANTRFATNLIQMPVLK